MLSARYFIWLKIIFLQILPLLQSFLSYKDKRCNKKLAVLTKSLSNGTHDDSLIKIVSMACNCSFLCENFDPVLICLNFVYTHNFRLSSLALF